MPLSPAYTYPLLDFVNHRPCTDLASCRLYQLAFVEKNRDAFLRKVTADDGSILLDSFGNPYEQLQVPQDTTSSILVLEEYLDIQEDLEAYFRPDDHDVGNLDPLLVPPAHKIYQIVARPRTGKSSFLYILLNSHNAPQEKHPCSITFSFTDFYRASTQSISAPPTCSHYGVLTAFSTSLSTPRFIAL
ncbi:hypothetical protein VNI00_005145 [Paramarasmius palmivorus]|uniref:Uncharacterized protein n=1 Tax=Paramarasmius palmivorus TaxID=297713 RepID=A0AAW0DIM0_9AGAR